LLQVLDDGRLSDNQGHTVDFTNTIIVMTTNIGSQIIQENARDNGRAEEMQEAVGNLVRQQFLPEFLNRIDDTIIFQPRQKKEIVKIAGLQLDKLTKQLAKQGIALSITESAIAEITERGYDLVYGARPLKRVIQQQIQNPLAVQLLQRKTDDRLSVQIDYKDGMFVFEREYPFLSR
jgi:ATP-dependent Clp protease ATP-binding subunit ClpB